MLSPEGVVTVNPLAQRMMTEFEDGARDEHREAGLAPVPAEGLAERPPARAIHYSLPFAEMFELVVEDVTRAAGLAGGSGNAVGSRSRSTH